MSRKKAEAPASAPEAVVYESREPEPTSFDVARVPPVRNFSNGRLEWTVQPEDVERFESNYFVQTGRVVRKHVD